jgi:hypothetical protein
VIDSLNAPSTASESKGQWLLALVVFLVLAAGVGALLYFAIDRDVGNLGAAWGVFGSIVTILGALLVPPPESKIKLAVARLVDKIGDVFTNAGSSIVALLWAVVIIAGLIVGYDVVINHHGVFN